MDQYYHSHKVIAEKCKGHMTCMRACPTRAIRVRGGTASISEELCVDCGTCIAVCHHDAITSTADPITDILRFKYKVAVPSPVLYTQFDWRIHPYIVHQAFKKLGFDSVIDVSTSSAALTKALVEFLKTYQGRRPLISSHCPSLVRLIQVKYPDLAELLVPLNVPREMTAREIRKNYPAKLDLEPKDIGIFYISPCPAKVVSIKQPAEETKSWFDGVFSINDTYSALFPHVLTVIDEFDESQVPSDFYYNPGWATFGSLTQAAETEDWLAVSGLDSVMKTFDDIENSKLRNIDFVEAMVCMLGCIGGLFTVENPYVARANNLKQKTKYEKQIAIDDQGIVQKLKDGYFDLENRVVPRPTKYFDTDLETSIKRMKERERVFRKLRQINCGCCGAPTCLDFAEDFVRGEVELTDCVFLALIREKEEEKK